VNEARYSTRLDDAILLATDAFRYKVRKGSGIPYLTHLVQVMVYVAEHGGDEDQMIAAVLHDYLEDIPGAKADDVEARFGPRVRRMVEALSDATTHPKPPWKERKLSYLEELRGEPAEVKLISAADKLHNARSIRRDFTTLGVDVFDRFTASKEETLWYYQSVVIALGEGWTHPLLDELVREVTALLDEAG
jgi:GTP pyrophosphokinase